MKKKQQQQHHRYQQCSCKSNLHIITRQIVSLPGNILAALCLLGQIIGAVVAYRIRVGLIVEVHECGRYGLHLARCLMQMLHLLCGRLPRIRVIQRWCRAHRFIWATYFHHIEGKKSLKICKKKGVISLKSSKKSSEKSEWMQQKNTRTRWIDAIDDRWHRIGQTRFAAKIERIVSLWLQLYIDRINRIRCTIVAAERW